jgi:8-oxo-dGTP diphosphatase
MESISLTPARRGVVGVLVREGRLLVIRRSEGVVAPLAYCFPGGGIEGDETEPVALVRELREELGIVVRPQKLLWRSTTPWNIELAWWLAEIDGDIEPEPNPLEVHSYAWRDVDEMQALDALLESNRRFLAAWARGEIELPGLNGEGETGG